MTYFEELQKAMSVVAEYPNTKIIGQTASYPGTAMYNTLKHLPEDKRMELPVAENMQLGMSIGMSLQGYLPVAIFPRWNFLLSATDQLVHHLDKLETMSQGEYKPKVIIRVGVGSEEPLNPGKQHVGEYSLAFAEMCSIPIWHLKDTEDIVFLYRQALGRDGSTILVEYMDMYNE